MSLPSKPAWRYRLDWESCFVCPCLPLQDAKELEAPRTLAAIVGRALQGPVGCKACLSLWQQPAPGKPEVYVCLPHSADAAGGERRRGPLGCLPTHPALLPDPPLYKRGTIPPAHTEREPMRRAETEGGHHQCPLPLGVPQSSTSLEDASLPRGLGWGPAVGRDSLLS